MIGSTPVDRGTLLSVACFVKASHRSSWTACTVLDRIGCSTANNDNELNNHCLGRVKREELQRFQLICESLLESLFSYESGQHADDASTLSVGNPVENFVDLVGIVDADAVRMAGLEGIETHYVLQIFRHELLELLRLGSSPV